jgi:glycosyltransferase involved in cell wall biosynthesis
MQSGRITLVPHIRNMNTYYASADLLVVPSLEEPLARVLLEAASFAVPAIISDIDGLPEGVVPHITGWIVRPGDARALAEAIEHGCELPLREYGLRAREYVDRFYGLEPYARQLLDFYGTIARAVN